MIELTHGMVLAAGLGTRMRPLTDATAKPLLTVLGRSLLDRAIDRMEDAEVKRVVVNAHWCPDLVMAAVESRKSPELILQREATLLETGGGVRRALPHLGGGPFAVANGDSLWLDGPLPALKRLASAYDPQKMDALLLVVRRERVAGEVGQGDFEVDGQGRVARPRGGSAPFVFVGVQILSPALFTTAQDEAFSLNRLYDQAIASGRLYALEHDGLWFHLSTPQDLAWAEARFRRQFIGPGEVMY